MKRLVLGLVVLAFSIPWPARAQGIVMKPDDVIAARQGGMAVTGGFAETMKAGVQSGADVKPFAAGAEGLVKWARAYPALFPDGSQSGHETKAKPEIWSDRAGFEKADTALVLAAERLAEAAKSGDKAAFADAFTTTTKACGACHKSYKER